MKELLAILLIIVSCGSPTLNDSIKDEANQDNCLEEILGSQSGFHAKQYTNCSKSDTLYIFNGSDLLLQTPFISPEKSFFRHKGVVTFSRKKEPKFENIIEEENIVLFPLIDANDRSIVFGINTETREKLPVKNNKFSLSSKSQVIYYNHELRHVYILQGNNVDHIPVNIYRIDNDGFEFLRSINISGIEIPQNKFISELLIKDQKRKILSKKKL